MVEGSGWLYHHTKNGDRAEMKHFVELKLTHITPLSKKGKMNHWKCTYCFHIYIT
jgi:hypothetical protein